MFIILATFSLLFIVGRSPTLGTALLWIHIPGSECRDHKSILGFNDCAAAAASTYRPQIIHFSPRIIFDLTFWNKIISQFLTHGLSLCRRRLTILITLVTISLNTYGILPTKAATVYCGQRLQHSWITGEPIRSRRPPQLLVAKGHRFESSVPAKPKADGHTTVIKT